MSDFSKLVPAHVQKLAAYKPGKPRRQAELESGMRCIKMASNENPFGPSPLAIEAIKAATAEVNFYPDNSVTELTARLAEMHGVETGAGPGDRRLQRFARYHGADVAGAWIERHHQQAVVHRLSHRDPRHRRPIHRSANRE